VARVERLYTAARGKAGPVERVARRQAIAHGIERLRQTDETRFLELSLRLRRYDQRLRRFQLRDSHLDWDVSAQAAVRFALREAALGIVLFPLAIAGLVIFWVPYQLTGRLARRATSEKDVAATATVFVGAAVYAAWLMLLVVGIWLLAGRGVILATIAIPLLAVAGLLAIEREGNMIDTARAWLVLRRARSESRARLKRERSELALVLDEVYEWLSAETPAPAAARTPN
jgi:type IV secretory pathway VirB3-like protein